MVCLLLSVSPGNGWPHNVLRHHWLMPISCHFRDCKALLVASQTYVSGAISSIQTFTFTMCFRGKTDTWSHRKNHDVMHVNRLNFRFLDSVRVLQSYRVLQKFICTEHQTNDIWKSRLLEIYRKYPSPPVFFANENYAVISSVHHNSTDVDCDRWCRKLTV